MSGAEMAFDENNFLEAFKNGDEAAFKELMEAYKKPLINLVYSLISNYDEAEEIIQDVFVSFYIKRESFEGRSKIYTWLYRVSFNSAVDHIRKKEREKDRTDDEDLHSFAFRCYFWNCTLLSDSRQQGKK